MSGQFQVAFISSEALKEYRKLDGSTKRLVDVAISRLKTRADENRGAPKGQFVWLQKTEMAKRGPSHGVSHFGRWNG